jgi:hypothetical protein
MIRVHYSIDLGLNIMQIYLIWVHILEIYYL